jgi:chromosome segregation ATPase
MKDRGKPPRRRSGRPSGNGGRTDALRAATARLRRSQRRVRALEAQVVRLTDALATARADVRQRVARARRRLEGRLTRMVQEIGQLRYHETRARALEAALAAREAELRRLRSPASGQPPAAGRPARTDAS